jgi:hypothetical protein
MELEGIEGRGSGSVAEMIRNSHCALGTWHFALRTSHFALRTSMLVLSKQTHLLTHLARLDRALAK